MHTSAGACVGVVALNCAPKTSWISFVIMCSRNDSITFPLGIQSISVCLPDPVLNELGDTLCSIFFKYLSS